MQHRHPIDVDDDGSGNGRGGSDESSSSAESDSDSESDNANRPAVHKRQRGSSISSRWLIIAGMANCQTSEVRQHCGLMLLPLLGSSTCSATGQRCSHLPRCLFLAAKARPVGYYVSWGVHSSVRIRLCSYTVVLSRGKYRSASFLAPERSGSGVGTVRRQHIRQFEYDSSHGANGWCRAYRSAF